MPKNRLFLKVLSIFLPKMTKNANFNNFAKFGSFFSIFFSNFTRSVLPSCSALIPYPHCYRYCNIILYRTLWYICTVTVTRPVTTRNYGTTARNYGEVPLTVRITARKKWPTVPTLLCKAFFRKKNCL